LCANEKNELNAKFDEEITKYLENITTDGIVSIDNVKRAHSLLECFNKTKLILSGYECDDWTASVSEIIADIISDIKEENLIVRTNEQLIANKIFSQAELCVELNDVNQSLGRKVNAKMIAKVTEKLETQNLGRVKLRVNTNGPATKYFEKKIIDYFTHDIINALQSYDIDLLHFKDMNTEIQRKHAFDNEK